MRFCRLQNHSIVSIDTEVRLLVSNSFFVTFYNILKYLLMKNKIKPILSIENNCLVGALGSCIDKILGKIYLLKNFLNSLKSKYELENPEHRRCKIIGNKHLGKFVPLANLLLILIY